MIIDQNYLRDKLEKLYEENGNNWSVTALWITKIVNQETSRCVRLIQCEFNKTGYDCCCENCRLAADLLCCDWNDMALAKK
jgi:hypothetical protein